MAIWTVEQQTETWWSVEVEAETYEEALDLSTNSDNWQPSDSVQWTDNFIVSDEDGQEVYHSWIGEVED